jgi:small-conductance mechanosensitive channel
MIPRPMLAAANLVAAATPTPAPTPTPTTTPPPLIDPSQGTCSPGTGGVICRWVYEATGSQTAADVTLWLIEKPLKIALILALAWIVIRLGKRAIRALVVTVPKRVSLPDDDEEADERFREEQRNASIERLLVKLLRFTVWFVAVVMILDLLGINVTPVIVSAGILGLALSLGAQTLVKDLLGGMSIIVDRRLAVGDFVDLADATGHVGTSGIVEAVGLSSTTLRNGDGEIWHVPNGDIRWIGNLSERWARIVIDVRVDYGTDLRATKAMFSAALAEVVDDERYRGAVLERPAEPFVRELASDAVVMRATVRVERDRFESIKADALERIAEALAEAGAAPA